MPKNILIVDDEEHNRELIEIILHREDYKLFFSENGQEALEVLKKESIDLLLLDLLMPKMDGFETLAEIKNLDIKVPYIIVITALGDEINRNKALNLGAQSYLLKPFDIIDLKQSINKEMHPNIKSSDKQIAFLSNQEARAISIAFLQDSKNNLVEDLEYLMKVFYQTTRGEYNKEEILALKKKYIQQLEFYL